MSRDKSDGILIAETGETGEVTWVWVLRNGDRIPRPFHFRDLDLPLHRFSIFGANRDEVATWVGETAYA